MSGHETDVEMVGRTRSGLAERAPEVAVPPVHAPELSSRAIADGRPDTLDVPSVVHLQSFAGNASVSRLLEDEQAPDKVKSVGGQGGGERLDAGIAQAMGERMGQDFSDVRIHSGGAASESAQAVNAQAYTVGNDVVFRAGQYDPSSPAGQRTLAHELTHVVQQREGAVSGSDIGGGLAVSDPADRFEREASSNADQIMASGTTTQTVQMSAQRHADEDGHPEIAQREADLEEEEEEMGAGDIAQREEIPEEEELQA
ncbi:MAG: DUF4157 domain-containing protein [Chloroflexi bacterium]|nr:DUF4157 domain-containing protein [Chloroflexota bacterium]